MDQEFWLERWENNQIGFHLRDRANPCLDKYWHLTKLTPGATVFVPLCGKSLDLLWFAEQGYKVIGVELAEKAVQDFFKEHQLTPSLVETAEFKCYQAANITLYSGDFFALTKAHLAQCSAVYDRAALVAWPPELQARYAAHLFSILPQASTGLVVVMDYLQNEMAGPPFAVSEAQLNSFLTNDYQVERVGQRDILRYEPKFVERGLTSLTENVFLLSAQTQTAGAN